MNHHTQFWRDWLGSTPNPELAARAARLDALFAAFALGLCLGAVLHLWT